MPSSEMFYSSNNTIMHLVFPENFKWILCYHTQVYSKNIKLSNTTQNKMNTFKKVCSIGDL